ncbi:MAG: NAD(P)/FAD-dependent oxidoreductase [Betaproteobacteria bacterium]|nr:NAD(P)/FAD-dependent oxidoreductase [Betaproteobacteria bacterium]
MQPDEVISQTQRWIEEFNRALAQDVDALQALFMEESYWRDVLALTWHYTTIEGRDAATTALAKHAREAGATGFALDPQRTPPRLVKRVGVMTIEALLRFTTRHGHASGVLRLVADAGDGDRWKAWVLHTALENLHGCEEKLGKRRPTGQSHSRDFSGPNWLDQRRAAAAYDDRDPAVLVVGAGQAGLCAAARLKMLELDTLMVDRMARIGDNWRSRYHALTLHNQVQVNHLPYMPFPPNWPTYLPKDKLAGWFEAYVEAMELNVWTATAFESAEYDHGRHQWNARVRRADGSVRVLHPRHVVMATGPSAEPNMPDTAEFGAFKGRLMHAAHYGDGEQWRGKRALVIGTGTSGHDIAQDLYGSGAEVTLAQRGSTLVVSIEPTGQLSYALYDEGPSVDDCDLIVGATPLTLGKRAHRLFTDHGKAVDRELHEGLARIGFAEDFGEEGTGWQYKYLTRGGGYYFNVGCSDLLIEGKIQLIQYPAIADFEARGARMKDGTLREFDLIVLATGYKSFEQQVAAHFGEAVAKKVGPIWGFGDEQELRNMFKRTAQEGLWVIGGSLAQCRINSKYLALQIKACEQGIIPLSRTSTMSTASNPMAAHHA